MKEVTLKFPGDTVAKLSEYFGTASRADALIRAAKLALSICEEVENGAKVQLLRKNGEVAELVFVDIEKKPETKPHGDVKYFYLRHKTVADEALGLRGKPVACIAYKREPDPDFQRQWLVSYGVSCCNPTDEFHKSEARRLAKKRLESKDIHGISIPEEAPALFSVIEALALVDEVPTRVKKAARRWLNSD